MTSIILSLSQVPPTQPEGFERLLRRAAVTCWLARFKGQTGHGAIIVNHDAIGETAGRIWRTLESYGPQTFAALMEELDAPESVFFMAIGWLSREDKLEFVPADGDYLIRLKS